MAAEPTFASTGHDADVYAVGARIARYSIVRCIGRGGMGIVYAAEDTLLGRTVALKLLATARAGSELLQRRLHREAQALARLSHPNVVTVFDVGVHGAQVYLAMELHTGGTLATRVADGASPDEIVRMFLEAGQGLAAAHDRGIIHRDFKPENVLVDDAGHVRVSDFGLARAAAEIGDEPTDGPNESPLDATMTEDGAVVGTPRYMAPEQRAGERATAQSDQYSFCVALWEALSGEVPREGRSPRMSRPIARVLDRGLSRDPALRFPSMRELLGELAPRRSTRRFAVIGMFVVLLLTIAVLVGYQARGRAEPAVEGSAWVDLDMQTKHFAIGVTGDGRATVFVRTPAGHVAYTSQLRTGVMEWNGWTSLRGSNRETPEVARHADGRLHVFIRGDDGGLWHVKEVAPDRWDHWESLGSDVAFPAIGINADGHLEIVIHGGAQTLWHVWEERSRGMWSAWWPMNPAKPTSPARIGRGADGRLHVFCVGRDGTLQHRAQTEPNNGWGEWVSHGGWFKGRPTVVTFADGTLGVIARSEDGAVWAARETGKDQFGAWVTLGHRVAGEIAWATNPDGRISLFAAGHDGWLWTTREQAGVWQPWTTTRDLVDGDPIAATTASGPVVIIRRPDGSLAARQF